MNHQAFQITAHRKYEVWAKFDDSAGVYECFADAEGETYIGCADTRRECELIARDWISEQTSF